MSDASYNLDHLTELEAESIYVLREVAAQFDRPAILFSGGKDSIVVTHLAAKASPQGGPHAPVHRHGTQLPGTLEFRDNLVERLGATHCGQRPSHHRLWRPGGNRRQRQPQPPSNHHADRHHRRAPIRRLHQARRDEEKARAKERFFSHRDDFSQWDPKNQRPELWNLFNGKHAPGEHFRVFLLNNWTELDVELHPARKHRLGSLYYAHDRVCIRRAGQILAHSEHLNLRADETPEMMHVRFRTLGDLTITGAFESDADTLEKIIEEVAATRITERGGRMDDKRSESAMEDRKKEGYF